jgi:nucleoside-diphosphate-sugar epimerase
MANPILVTGAAGRVGAVGRTVTELLLKQGKAVRAMVRTEDERAQALRASTSQKAGFRPLDLVNKLTLDQLLYYYFSLTSRRLYEIARQVSCHRRPRHKLVQSCRIR